MNPILQRAHEAWRQGQGGEAETLCRQLLKVEPRNAEALTHLGVVLAGTGRPAEGLRALQTALEVDKLAVEPCIILSRLLGSLGDPAGSVRAAQMGVVRGPEDGAVYTRLGQSFAASQQFGEAVEAFRIACELSPDSGAAHRNFAIACQRFEFHEETEKHLLRAIELEPEVVVNRLALGGHYLAVQRESDAAKILADGLQYSVSNPDLHMLLGKALLAQADAGLAGADILGEEHLRKSISLGPMRSTPYATLGARYQALGRFDEARELLEKAIELEPNRAAPYLVLARNGRYTPSSGRMLEKIISLIESKTVSGKELSHLHYAVAHAFDDLGDPEKAMSHYEAANQLMHAIYRPNRPFDRADYAERFEAMRRVFTPEVLSAPPVAEPQTPTPIFVIGMMRSGTSLVEQILASHPDVHGCGELSFWRDQADEFHRKGPQIPSELAITRLRDEFGQLLASLSPPGTLFASDKLPQNYESLGLIHLAFPEAPIVYIRRNPIDTCLSIFATPYDNPPIFGFDKGDIAFAYEQQKTLMLHWLSAVPAGRIHEVCYEELVEDSEPVIRRMIESCGLKWSDACLSHEKTERVVNTPNRWEVRQPVYTSSIDRARRFEPWLGEFSSLTDE